MNRDALAFFRILPAGAADIGGDVSRDELRAEGAGAWFLAERIEDDVSCLFPSEPKPMAMADFDELLPMAEAPPAFNGSVIQLRFRSSG